jgi:hypothetical protein
MESTLRGLTRKRNVSDYLTDTFCGTLYLLNANESTWEFVAVEGVRR